MLANAYQTSNTFGNPNPVVVPVGTITPSTTQADAGEVIRFTGTSSLPNSTFLWSTGETAEYIDVTAPIGNTSSVTTVTLVVTSSDGVESSIVTSNVNVSAFIPVDSSDYEFIEETAEEDVFDVNIDEIFAAAFELGRYSDNTPIFKSLEEYTGAEYTIFDNAGVSLLTLTLGSGVTKNGTDFVVHVPSSALTFTGTYKHQLVAVSSSTRDLMFKRKVTIQGGY